MKIENGKRVRLKAMLKVSGGDVIEKSVVEYFQGSGTMLPGLESVLAGLEKGAQRKGVLPAKDAFGAMQPTKKMRRTEFPSDAKLEKGEEFGAKGANGQDVLLRVENITGDDIIVKLVHPLATKDIEYDVEVLSVTDPTPPPLPGDALKPDED